LQLAVLLTERRDDQVRLATYRIEQYEVESEKINVQVPCAPVMPHGLTANFRFELARYDQKPKRSRKQSRDGDEEHEEDPADDDDEEV
jgi:hypothetical protein